MTKYTARADIRGRVHAHLSILGGIAIAVIITLVLHPVKKLLERTRYVTLVEDALYDVLQLRIASKVNDKDVPVDIIDTSKLRWMPFDQARGNSQGYTSRVALEQKVESLFNNQPLPRAIGIDVDFSSPDDNYFTPEDAAFFEFCLQKRRDHPDIPLVVGVTRSLSSGPKVLTDPKYLSLAAYVQQPNPEKYKSFKRMDEWISVPYIRDDGTETIIRFASMANALTGPLRRSAPWPDWFATNVFFVRQGDIYRKEFVVDYGALEVLLKNSPTESKDVITRPIVILGRTNDTTDQFAPPGFAHETLPGVYAHASAAYTILLDRLPLCEVREPGALLLDFVFAIGLAGCVAGVRNRYRRKHAELPPERVRFVQSWFTLAGIALAFLIGFGFVHVWRVMWDELFLVMISLAAHDAIERSGWFEGLASMLPTIVHRLFLERQPIKIDKSPLLLMLAVIFNIVFSVRPTLAQELPTFNVEKPVGMVVNVGCSGWLDSRQFGRTMRIDNMHDRGRPLYVGDKLQCKGDGALSIWISGSIKPISSRQGWVAVENNLAITAAQRAKQEAVSNTLDQVSHDRATRAETPVIFSPLNGGVARPETLVIRWNSEKGDTGILSFSLWQPHGKKLCCDQGAQALRSAGKMDSKAIRSALIAYRSTQGRSSVELRIVDSTQTISTVKFSLLDADEELILEQEMARWEEEQDPMVRHMGRASVYNLRNLRIEAASEFDQMLQEARPPSVYLFKEAIQAHLQAGNATRAKDLEEEMRRLSSSTVNP